MDKKDTKGNSACNRTIQMKSRDKSKLIINLSGCVASAGVIYLSLIIYWTTDLLGGYSWRNADTVFNLHPLLTSLGFIIMPAMSMILLKLTKRVSPETREKIKILHATLNGLGFFLCLIGITFAYKSKELKKNRHLWTCHSWFGLGLTVCYGLMCSNGNKQFVIETENSIGSRVIMIFEVIFLFVTVVFPPVAMFFLTNKSGNPTYIRMLAVISISLPAVYNAMMISKNLQEELNVKSNTFFLVLLMFMQLYFYIFMSL
ncbi:hypothetical protein GJ496_011818 [Pomphorhynchus laevis]|nr:hypothetical protein GJ496_011818 [Pomphorhynchus laevis]